ncbi:MBOAT family O-acyltransferase [Salinibacter ruber]|uniref:MBOAT family O-acyltransferase n=1 Tax=Salinibacter ruber TaxID=146919 RepID=UPI000E56C849|nr:MBOAT family protein [Salinibacter ruber]
MLFNSLEFLVFFPVVVGLYFTCPSRYRWGLLLAASYYFYASWKLEYLGLIVASTLVDYWVGRRMGALDTHAERRPYLLISLGVNLGILFAFKYFNFVNESVRAVFQKFDLFYGVPAFDVLLPVGISFYTFQTLAYSIDVYREKKEPETHLGIFALYVSFFPQLVAGPIERSQRLIPQFKEEEYSFDYERVTSGLKLMAWGFFKKLVVADRLAIYVDEVYNHPGLYEGWPVVLATYFFAFQIYCDFSGYSDIAIGAARVMGYDLMENFRRPYFSKSISEFWRRWHISLSSWFKDYLYIPLGGNRVSVRRWYVNLLIVFVVSGLWHGAAWTFAIWGALHGVYMVLGAITASWRDRVWSRIGEQVQQIEGATRGVLSGIVDDLRRGWQVLATFHLVLLAWIFFRANSLPEAVTLLESFFAVGSQSVLPRGVSSVQLALSIFGIGVLGIVHLIERMQPLDKYLDRYPVPFRWGAYYAIIGSILIFGVFTQKEFIYFQF